MDNTRKLVTIREISAIIPHPNADKLEIAMIGGWQVIVAKDAFKRGDEVVYFEIDSLIPISEEFEFLRKYAYTCKVWLKGLIPNNEGFRIKTIKLRGEISQGLVIPLSNQLIKGLITGEFKVTDDFTNHFGVIKYDPPVYLSQNQVQGTKGNFPEFFPKTRQERVQNVSKGALVEAYVDDERFEITRKYHGMSLSVYAIKDDTKTFFEGVLEFFGISIDQKYTVGVCSHNVELNTSNEANVFVKAAKESGLMDAVHQLALHCGFDIAVQGELCGPGIQSNYHSLEQNTIFVFDIYDITNGKYLAPMVRSPYVDMLIDIYGFTGKAAMNEYPYTHLLSYEPAILLKLAEFDLPNGNPNEGLVFKSLERDFSFKVVSNAFLLAEK